MNKISPDFIEQVRLANDLVDIIGEDIFLKRSGSRYTGLCPFPTHNEKTPSFSVSQDQQLYHCFGCGQSGNIFTYLQVKRGYQFMEALKILARRAGMSIPNTSVAEDKQYAKRKKLLQINKVALEFYEKNLRALKAEHPIQKFLRERKISLETTQTFRLGYAPSKWDGLLNYLKDQGCDLELAEELSLIRKKKYDFFRDRLMFPILEKDGRLVLGFGGRTLDSKQPKYINSIDSPVFHKRRTFYGWQQTASIIRDSGRALVVEGYTDYLSLYQRGVRNVLATLGTALTEDHARWLSHYVEQVVLSFDGDPAGEKAAERSLNILLSFGLVPKVLKLEEGLDPDGFIRKKGKKEFERRAEAAQDLFLTLFLKELKKYPAGVDRFSLIQKIAHTLASTQNSVLREYYQARFLDSFGFDEEVARRALKVALKKETKKQTVSFREEESVSYYEPLSKELPGVDGNRKQEKISLKNAPKAELFLLILSLENEQVYKVIKNSKVVEKVGHPGIISLFKHLEEYSAQELSNFEALSQLLSGQLEDPRSLQKESHPPLSHLSKKKMGIFIQDCINKVEEEKKHLNLKTITANMRRDQQNTDKYLKKIVEWTRKSRDMENKI